MERLSDRAIAIVNELHTERLDYQSEYLPLIDALNQLAAYEDTELTPEICANYKKFEDEAVSKGVTFNRIVELMEAERDGRLVVLPCKIGDTVYWLDYNRDACHSCNRYSSFYGMDSMCGDHYELYPEINSVDDDEHCPKHFVEIIEYVPTKTWIFNHRADFGKTVFLTREEAETALKGGGDK